jgi:hypothetical protein
MRLPSVCSNRPEQAQAPPTIYDAAQSRSGAANLESEACVLTEPLQPGALIAANVPHGQLGVIPAAPRLSAATWTRTDECINPSLI